MEHSSTAPDRPGFGKRWADRLRITAELVRWAVGFMRSGVMVDVGRLNVRGGADFCRRAEAALELLTQRAPEAYALVQQHVGLVIDWPRSLILPAVRRGRVRVVALVGPAVSTPRALALSLAAAARHGQLVLQRELVRNPVAQHELDRAEEDFLADLATRLAPSDEAEAPASKLIH